MLRSRNSRPPRPPTVSIVLLVAFIAGVFAFIGFRQIQSAEERRMRLLAGFADRVETTVPDLADRFARIVSQRCARRVRFYLALVPNVEYLGAEPGEDACPRSGERAPPRAAADGPGIGGRISLVTPGAEVRLLYDRDDVPDEAGEEDATTEGDTAVDAPETGAGAEAAEETPARDGSEAGSWIARSAEARIDLQRVIDPMIIPGVFDSVLVANADGTVLHQQGEPELRIRHLGGLLGAGNAQGWTTASLAAYLREGGGEAGQRLAALLEEQGRRETPLVGGAATAIFETQVANSDYAVFLQPITLRFEPIEGQAAPETVRWLAAGVISTEHLLSAGVTTSPILLFLLIAILPLGLVSWPFLKLTLTSRRQPFTRLDFASLILASILALSLLALLLVDGLFLLNVRNLVDRQLAGLSEVVGEDLRQEVLDAYLQLERFNAAHPLYSDRVSRAEDHGAIGAGALNFFDFVSGPDRLARPEETADRFILDRVEPILTIHQPRIYPYFDSVFWPDEDGEMVAAALPLRDHAVLPQNVKDRGYFECARSWEDPGSTRITLRYSEAERARYWLGRSLPRLLSAPPRALDRGPAEPLPWAWDGRVELCLQPLLDRTTGESVTAVSIPGPRAPEDGEDPRGEHPVAALVAPLTSVHHPVLPPHVGFAVVDRSGMVLYHSDTRRALTENFLKASDEDRLLASMIEARREGPLSLHYWGRRHRAHVRPVPDLPWTLVTFRNMQDVRIRNFELIYDFLNPFVLTLAILALLAAVFKWTFPQRFRAYLWPSSVHLASYRRIVHWTLVVLAAFFLLLMFEDLGYVSVFLASVAVVPLSCLYVIWGLRKLHQLLDGEGGEPAGTERLRARALRIRLRALKRSPRARAAACRFRRLYRRAAGRVQRLRALRDRWLRLPDRVRLWIGSAAPPADGESPDELRLVAWQRRRRGALTVLLLLFAAYLYFALHRGVDVLQVFVAAAFFAVLIALEWYRSQFEGDHRRKVAYVFALSCLLLLSLLPALGFLHLARSRQIQFFTQDAMIALAQDVHARQARLARHRGPLAEEHYRAYDGVLACVRDGLLDVFFSSRLREPGADRLRCPVPLGADIPRRLRPARVWPYGWNRLAAAERPGEDDLGLHRRFRRALGRGMIQLLSARPIPLNELSPGPGGVDLSRYASEHESPETPWLSRRDGSDRAWLVLDTRGGGGSGEGLELASMVPDVGSASAIPDLAFFVLVLGLVALGGGPFLLARFIARRLLLISLVYYGKRQPETSRRDLSLRVGPLDSVDQVLDEALREADSEDGVVKRLVLVAGQLHREAWKDLVERGDYHEASFRRSWRRAMADSPRERGTEAREIGRPDRLPARARRFGEQLASGGTGRRPILVVDFDPETSDPSVAADQAAGLRFVTDQRERSVVILCDTVPLREPPPGSDERLQEAHAYWLELLGAFPVRYARDIRLLDDLTARELEGRRVLGRLVQANDLAQADHWRRIVRRIVDECEHTPTLRQLGCQLLHEVSVEVELERVEATIAALETEIPKLERAAEPEPPPAAPTRGGGARRVENDAQAEAEAYAEEERRRAERRLARKRRHKALLERRKEEAEGYRALVTEDHVVGRVGAEARLHYRYLWSQCSTDEKLVLVQLAENGLVNPRYFSWVLDLMNRGLVVRSPDLRIMNRSFERFVRQEVRRGEILEWQEQLGPSAWGVLKWIVPFPLLGLAAFLFITQRDAVSNAAGVLVALASLTPVVFNLYAKFQEVNLRRSQERSALEDEAG